MLLKHKSRREKLLECVLVEYRLIGSVAGLSLHGKDSRRGGRKVSSIVMQFAIQLAIRNGLLLYQRTPHFWTRNNAPPPVQLPPTQQFSHLPARRMVSQRRTFQGFLR